MSFSPLPAPLQEQLVLLGNTADPLVLDLGCGDGGFSRSLAGYGIPIWGLDRSVPALARGVQIRADACRPPIRPHCLDLILAGNLVRHLLAQNASGVFLSTWARLLKPGGMLVVLEDSPGNDTGADRNFRDLQAFLAQLAPGRRGPLLTLGGFRQLVDPLLPGGRWQTGSVLNANRPDAAAVLEFLAGQGGAVGPRGPGGQLLESIRQQGLSYGSYWWAMIRF